MRNFQGQAGRDHSLSSADLGGCLQSVYRVYGIGLVFPEQPVLRKRQSAAPASAFDVKAFQGRMRLRNANAPVGMRKRFVLRDLTGMKR
ncbi:hypothetical protein AQ1_00815 [alpha proteobacterium Q-1]|nr:hypothetical protein AQ1_00815 [alpha proteobacterium Q-1]